jgi:phosphatidylethanolamine-binding protein (PEBP) family uncharacterized protein
MIKRLLIFLLVFPLTTFAITSSNAATSKSSTFQAEVWADNWFALYINGKKVGEDSVPITTTKSFNSEKIKFTATYPFTIGVIAKDYTENSSGLEYIGQPKQQIGDAGIVLQIRDVTSGKIVSATDKSWKTLLVNKAPLNTECVNSNNPIQDCEFANTVIPANWATSTFKDSQWKSATEFTEKEVGVKEGYLDISWSPSSKLIWTSDLKLDNTILIRKIVTSSAIVKSTSTKETNSKLTISSKDVSSSGELNKSNTCDGEGISPALAWSGAPKSTKSYAITMNTIPGPLRPGETEVQKHSYFTVFNIPVTATSLSSGAKNIGTIGRNFKDNQPGYSPPCSQGPGTKTYTITVYALSSELTLAAQDATEDALIKAMAGKVLASGELSVTYSRS